MPVNVARRRVSEVSVGVANAVTTRVVPSLLRCA